jgi:hypothetical protein
LTAGGWLPRETELRIQKGSGILLSGMPVVKFFFALAKGKEINMFWLTL